MVTFPNAKINLGLRVTAKRPDGYHDIETVFYPVPLFEALELTKLLPSRQHEEPFEFTVTGAVIPGDPARNLCVQAYEMVKNDHPISGHLRMHLHKRIPTGAGLGGGSADGAFALKLLNDELHLDIPDRQMMEYALRLGSDCPFFLLNKPCLAIGRGEILESIELNMDSFYFVLVHPDIHIGTSWAYGKTSPRTHTESLKAIIQRPVETWKENLTNDFEAPVFIEYPAIKRIREELYAAGATYASLSGSGSCVYGLFPRTTEFVPDSISGGHRIFQLKNNH